jgi:hypothetical protein
MHPHPGMTHRPGVDALSSCFVFVLGLLALATASEAAAQAVTGSGALRGSGALAVQRCGRDHLRAEAHVLVAPDGTWSATTVEGAAFSGTSIPTGTSGRKLELTFDAESEAGFLATMAQDAAELCRTSIQVTSATKRKFILSINRRATRAKLELRYTGTGIGGGRSGWARSGLTLKGPWTPG